MNFTDLLDAFASYTDKGEKIIRVKSTEDGLEAVEPGNVFIDNFDDDDLSWAWLTDETDANRTITESGGVLTIAIANGTDGTWWTTANKAPKVITGVRGYPCEIITKINNTTIPADSSAGIFIAYDALGYGNSCYAFIRVDSDKISVGKNGTYWSQPAITGFPIWLRIRMTAGTGGTKGGRLIFGYSLDGETFTDLYTGDAYNYAADTCGLFVRNWGAFPAVSVPFEFFKLTSSKGPG